MSLRSPLQQQPQVKFQQQQHHLHHRHHLISSTTSPTVVVDASNPFTPHRLLASDTSATTTPVAHNKPTYSSPLRRRRHDMISQSMPSSRPTLGSSRSYTVSSHSLNHLSVDNSSCYIPLAHRVASAPNNSTTAALKRPQPDDHSSSDGRAGRPTPLKVARTMSSSSVEHLKAPDNFATVAGQVYRSSFPKPENFGYLKKLGLKTVITLVADPYPEENVKFMKENGITHVQIGMPGNKEQEAENVDPRVPDEKITAALFVILDKVNHPLLIHCNKGKHRTGTVVGCLRKFQGWTLAQTLNEYRHYAGIKSRERDQLKITHYDLTPCWETAVANGWVPTATLIANGEKEEGAENVDSILSLSAPAAIRAQ